MNLAVMCPIPPEFRACKSSFSHVAVSSIEGYRIGHTLLAGNNLYLVQTGPGRKNACDASRMAIKHLSPDILVDAGTCCGLTEDARIGDIVLATDCLQLPVDRSSVRPVDNEVIPSSMFFFPRHIQENFRRAAVKNGEDLSLRVHIGRMVCGTKILQSGEEVRRIHDSYDAVAFNWETCGVFIASVHGHISGLSTRVVSDYGNYRATVDFILNVRSCMRRLIGFLTGIVENGWIAGYAAESELQSKD